jgi:hypothetical protein
VASGSILGWPAPLSLLGDAYSLASFLGAKGLLDRLPGRHLAFLGHQGHSYLLLVWDEAGDRVLLLDEVQPYLHVDAAQPVTFVDWLKAEVDLMLARTPDPYEAPPPFE